LIFFGHIGPSLLAARASTSDERFDAKAAMMTAAFAVMPDVIDKSIFELGLAPELTGRLWAHSIIGAVIICLLVYRFAKPAWHVVLASVGKRFRPGMESLPA
jgi:hypothetical protein